VIVVVVVAVAVGAVAVGAVGAVGVGSNGTGGDVLQVPLAGFTRMLDASHPPQGWGGVAGSCSWPRDASWMEPVLPRPLLEPVKRRCRTACSEGSEGRTLLAARDGPEVVLYHPPLLHAAASLRAIHTYLRTEYCIIICFCIRFHAGVGASRGTISRVASQVHFDAENCLRRICLLDRAEIAKSRSRQRPWPT
jgi:hypothetical protein